MFWHSHSYARLSRTLIRVALRAENQLAAIDRTVMMPSQIGAPMGVNLHTRSMLTAVLNPCAINLPAGMLRGRAWWPATRD